MAAAQADTAQQRMRRTLGIAAAMLVTVIVIVLITRDDSTDTTATDSSTAETTEPTDSADPTDTAADDTPATSSATEGCPAEDGSSPRTIDFAGPHPMCIDPSKTHVAVFSTSEGEIRVTLDTENTPGTANNFVTLARWGYYDGTTIHRTDPSIDIIQGGSPRTESAADPGPGYTIPDEPQFEQTAAGLSGPYRYVPGQLVMARTGAPNSASAQYFFTTGPNAALLDGQGIYVVFGETDAAGLAVLQNIIGLHEPGGALGGAPSRTVTIDSLTIEVS